VRTPQATGERQAQPGTERLLTVPNVLSAVRLVVSPALVALAWADQPAWCLGLAVGLFLVDWLDGKLAVWLKQQTVFGARLDSVADATLYGCTLAALLVLRGDFVLREVVWVGLGVGSYPVSVAACLLKFRRLPSYHTRLAKVSWFLTLVAVLSIFGDWSPWPLRGAMAAVLLTNLEATAITLVLPAWRVNVPSLFHAVRAAKAGPPPG
jgi:CDP-diacylglycerol--glycerol-3-phosphate 3-phosphatidyltransferase